MGRLSPRCGRLALAVLVPGMAVAMAACQGATPSTLAPDQDVVVNGRLLGADGKPVGGTRVVLYRQPGATETLGNLFVITTSVGLACLADDPPQLCRDSRKASSNGDGKFEFKLKGSDTYDRGLNLGSPKAGTFVVSSGISAASDEVAGPDTVAGFKLNVASAQLPDLRFWHPALAYAGTAGADPSLTFDGLPAEYGSGPNYEADFLDPAGDVIWDFTALKSPATFDRRLLEDFTGSVAVHAHSVADAPGTSYSLDHRSQGIRFSGTAGKPLSRQRACYAYDARGTAVRQSPCQLTDGDIAHVYQPHTENSPCPAVSTSPAPPRPSGCGDPRYEANYVDLGASARVDFVVVRGFTGSCVIETSGDGSHWTSTSPRQVSSDKGVAGFGFGEVSARYVRVTLPESGVSRLTEVSIWGPPGQVLPPAPEAPLPPPAAASPGHTSAPGRPAAAVIVGAAALGLVLLGLVVLVVFLLLRRRGGGNGTGGMEPPPTPRAAG